MPFTSLSQNVADKISNMILVQRLYKPGDKLPNERQLADELGVSRTSIREAIKLLVAGGVLRIKRGAGTYVTEQPGMQEDPLGLSKLPRNKQLMLNWYETRLILEPEIVRLAAERASDKELREIAQLEEISEARSRIYAPDFTAHDHAFHTAIVKAAHNEVIARLWAPLTDDGLLSWNALMNQRPDMREQALNAHKEIVKALCARDGLGASLAMRRHLLVIVRNMQQGETGFLSDEQ